MGNNQTRTSSLFDIIHDYFLGFGSRALVASSMINIVGFNANALQFLIVDVDLR